jgi:predicted phage tail protein
LAQYSGTKIINLITRFYKEFVLMVKSAAERLGIVETKVENLDSKMDELKSDVKEMHDCLDKTRDDLKAKLDEMYGASCTQHAELAKKMSEMEKLKDKWTYTAAGALVVLSWATAHIDKIMAVLK